MKKIFGLMLLCVAAIGFSSCEKEETVAIYTFRNDFVNSEVMLFEYTAEGDKINSQTIKNCVKGETYTFVALPQAVKVKAYLTYSVLFEEKSRWVQRVYLLDKKTTTEIVVNGETIIGIKEP